MKSKILFLLALICASSAIAQYGPQQLISQNADLAIRAIPHDMDQDGFIDVVSASYGDAKVAWYRNLNGLGDFSEEIIITNSAAVMEGMELVDIDGDGDMDVLFKSNLDKIAWLENMDGLGSFGAEQLISQNGYPYAMKASDLDMDGDLDMIALLSGQGIVWFENLDGQGNYGPAVFIAFPFGLAIVLVSMDLDNDNDMDIIVAVEDGPASLNWFENDGSGNFAPIQEIYQFSFSSDFTDVENITTTDINADGKIDLLIDTEREETPDYTYWLENLDNAGNFSNPNLIDVKTTSLGSLKSYDLDNDNDLDVLVSYYYNGSYLAWYENMDGQGNFGPKRIINTSVQRATDASAADLNGDGILDIISASSFDDKIAWYQGGVLGIEDATNKTLAVYPNPTYDRVLIKSTYPIQTIIVFDRLGNTIKTVNNSSEIDLSEISSGMYFMNIEDANGVMEMQKILKL